MEEDRRPTAAAAAATASSYSAGNYFELEPNAGAPLSAASFLPVWSSLFQQSPPRYWSSQQSSHLATNSDLLKESLHGGGGDAGEKSHRRKRSARVPGAVIAALVVLLIISAATLGASLISPSVRHAIFGTPKVYVAFIGNSIMYYYDLPRSLQIVSDYRIQQNSCLSGAGSLVRMPTLQNGMWNRWRSDGALLYTLDDDEVSVNNNYENAFYDNKVWDLGACTMEMLLFGYNHTEAQQNYYDFWEYRQENGVTDDDAWVYDYGSDLDPRLNDACTQSQTYLDFLNNLPSSDLRKNPTHWDYLVLVDRTSGPKNQNSRDSGLSALEEIYLPFFRRTKATPVLLVSASYWNHRDDDSISTSLDQIPSLTFKMYQGYVEYAEFLKAALPRSQKPRLINMGIAYLVVYEEDLDLWYSLFWTDDKHPSPHGSFLESCLLHHVIYGRVPYKSTVIRDDMQSLWNGTRDLMYPRDAVVPFPTKQEAEYLYTVCKRVAGGYIPPTFTEQLLKNGLSLYK